MKTKKTKTKKIMAAVLAFILIGVILFFANGLVGNPVSKMLANKAAEKYIDENYDDLDLEIEKAIYNFKDGNYFVRVKSNTSIDTHFEIYFTWSGKFYRDSYEDEVLSRWNTRMRIEDEYRNLVKSKVENKINFDERDFLYGGFIDKYSNFGHLEIDKIYDVKELAKAEGHINLHIESDTRNVQIMTETLIKVREMFDEEDIPFYSIDIDLNERRIENDKQGDEQKSDKQEEYLMIKNFLYSDIYLEDLEERVEENIKETKSYYEEQDKEMQEEISQYEEDVKNQDKY